MTSPLAIVLPVLDEARNLERLLPELCARAPRSDVVVVDGGSGDDSAAVVGRHAGVRWLTGPRGRALQMNAGAGAAVGEVLLFLHADTRLPPDFADAIAVALEDPSVVGGRFDVRFDNPGAAFRMIATMMNVRSRLSGIFTGDQAIFVRRSIFESLGGYPAIPLMEDIELSRRLKQRGRVACLRERVTTSARKWERDGVLRTILLMWTLRFLYAVGVSPARLHRWYYPPLRALAGVALVALLAAAPALADETSPARGAAPEIARFTPPADPDGPPPGWEPLTFTKVPKATRYTVVREGESHVLRAESRAAASGLYRVLDLDPRVHQVLAWRWKVDNVIEKADARTRKGDDYAARVYVAFRYDPARATLWERTTYGIYRVIYGKYPPRGVLNYVWDNRLPVGTVLDNAYTGRAKMIVVESGPALAGRWVSEARNVYDDYRLAFGGEPPRIAGVAVMTDTDDTGESAVAYYDAITLRARD
jgi:rSAM/selenodomain-associated transferase 2